MSNILNKLIFAFFKKHISLEKHRHVNTLHNSQHAPINFINFIIFFFSFQLLSDLKDPRQKAFKILKY